MKKICLFLSLALLALSCTEKEPDTPPVITSVDPVSGGYGTEIVITGSDFGSAVSLNSVTIGGVDAEVTAVTSSTLTVKVPALSEGDNQVIVTAPGGTTEAGVFNYICDVFVAGDEFNSDNISVAKYWKNGVAVTLSDGVYTTSVSDIAVSGDDVYIIGTEYTSSTVRHARLWINGVESSLTSNTYSGTYDIELDGDDVYIVGYENVDGNNVAVYWKNGTPVYLNDGSKSPYIRAITVSDGDIFLAGSETDNEFAAAKYWKNGIPVIITDGQSPAMLYDIVVDGDDVYVCGVESINSVSTAKVWKNGVAVTLGDGINRSYAYCMAVSGSDVHTIGGTNYWLNGTKSTFAGDEPDVVYYQILIKNDDIYAAGSNGLSPEGKAAYWKNGTEVLLTDGTYNACAAAIAVR